MDSPCGSVDVWFVEILTAKSVVYIIHIQHVMKSKSFIYNM